MAFSNITPGELEREVGNTFDFQLRKSFLEDFLNVHEQKKYRLLAAIKDLLNRFTVDIQKMNTENKTKLVNFLLKNHEGFVSDILTDDSILSKMDEVVYEIVKSHQDSSGSNSSTSSSSFQVRTVESAILDICNATITLATKQSNFSKRVYKDLPEVKKHPGEINIEKQTEKIIEKVRSKMSSSASLSADFSSSNVPVFIPKNVFIRTRQNSLKAKSIITQLIGISTVTVQLSDKLIRERSIATAKIKGIFANIKEFFSDKTITAPGGFAYHVPSMFAMNFPILHSLSQGVGRFTEFMKRVFGSKTSGFIFGGGVFVISLAVTGLVKIASRSFWTNIYGNFMSWMKGYTKQIFKYVGKQMLFNAIPILNGRKIGNSFQSMSKALARYGFRGIFKPFAIFSQMILLKKILGGYFKFVFATYKFIFNATTKLLNKTSKLVSNPLKRLMRFTFKLLKMPWVFILLGTIFGKLMSSAIDFMFTGDFDKKLEREVTDDMPALKRLGSSGILSYIQNELDVVSDILEAVNDVMGLKMPEAEKTGLENLGYSSEITEEEARQKGMLSNVYGFAFNAAAFVTEYLLPSGDKPPKIVEELQKFMDAAKKTLHIDELMSRYDFGKEKEKQSNRLKDMIGHSIWEIMENDAIGHAADSVWNFVSVFAGNAAGKQAGAMAFKAGIHLPFAPAWLKIITAIGGHTLASSLTAGAVQGYLNSDLNLNQTETSQLTRLQETYSHKYTSNRERGQMNLLRRNLTAGHEKVSAFGTTLKRLGSVHSENRGLVEKALKGGEVAEAKLRGEFGNIRTGDYYSANDASDTRAAKFNKFIEDKLVPIMEKDQKEAMENLRNTQRQYWDVENNRINEQLVWLNGKGIGKLNNDLYVSIKYDPTTEEFSIDSSKNSNEKISKFTVDYLNSSIKKNYKKDGVFINPEPYTVWGHRLFNSYILYALINKFKRGQLNVDHFIKMYNGLISGTYSYETFTKPFFSEYLHNAINLSAYNNKEKREVASKNFDRLFDVSTFWHPKSFDPSKLFTEQDEKFKSADEASNIITRMLFDGDNGLNQRLLSLNLNDYQIKDLKSSANQFFRGILLAEPSRVTSLSADLVPQLNDYFYAMAIDQYFATQDNPMFKDLQQKLLAQFPDSNETVNKLVTNWHEITEHIDRTTDVIEREHKEIVAEVNAKMLNVKKDQDKTEESANDIIESLSALNEGLQEFSGVSSDGIRKDPAAAEEAQKAGGLYE